MNIEKEFYSNLKTGRCKECGDSRAVGSTGNFMFLGCFCKPYDGKSVTEIKDCPKQITEQN